jgi:hypothetical protein
MIKKQHKILSKSNLTISLSVIALIVGFVTLYLTMTVWDNLIKSNESTSEQVFRLTIRNAQQDYCIDYSIKPCTADAIVKDSEKQK